MTRELQAWELREIEKNAARLDAESIERGGLRYWREVGRLVPCHCFFEAGRVAPVGQAEAEAAAAAKFMAEYRAMRRRVGRSAEEKGEARAAHGRGVRLVDVVTGESWTT